jgi:hypothetical protein
MRGFTPSGQAWQHFELEGLAMDNSKQSLRTFISMLTISVAAALLMMAFDRDGSVWLKFFLYLVFFLALTSPSLFFANRNCTAWLSRLFKRSEN